MTFNKTVTLEIDGSRQRVRLSAARPGLPPLLIVQGGPALPLLNDVPRFQRLLNLERDFLVAYWEQRGCGDASEHDVRSVSLARQVEDLRAVLQWLHAETSQRVVLFGISIGATIALQAAELESDRVRSIVAISPDSQTGRSDAAADAFLQDRAARAGQDRIRRHIARLGRPPVSSLDVFQHRARVLADLGTIEHGKRFGGLVRGLLISVFRTYGVAGGLRALRNINAVLRRLLPELADVDLIARPPRVTVPVHYVFGEQDALVSASMIADLSTAVAAPESTIRGVANAGHMVHFDQPHVVRSIVERA